MAMYLIRHAKAGDRDRWTGDDRERPLTKSGRAQAEGLVARLADAAITQVVSSPYVRCVETVEPLATARGLPVGVDHRLTEGASFPEVLGLLDELGDGAALCSHGDVIPDVIDALIRRGARVVGQPDWRKGSTWKLERSGQSWTTLTAAAPPV